MDTGGKYPVGGPSPGKAGSMLPGAGDTSAIDVSVNGAGCGNGYDGPVSRAMDMAPVGGLGSSGTRSNSSKR